MKASNHVSFSVAIKTVEFTSIEIDYWRVSAERYLTPYIVLDMVAYLAYNSIVQHSPA